MTTTEESRKCTYSATQLAPQVPSVTLLIVKGKYPFIESKTMPTAKSPS